MPVGKIWPQCGGSITQPWNVSGTPNIYGGVAPPLGYAAWAFMLVPDPSYGDHESETYPIQARLLDAPVPNGIEGGKLIWTGDWLSFTLQTHGADIEWAGDVLFLPMMPARDYTVEARQVAPGSGAGEGLVVYSPSVFCTVSVGYSVADAATSLETIEYRT